MGRNPKSGGPARPTDFSARPGPGTKIGLARAKNFACPDVPKNPGWAEMGRGGPHGPARPTLFQLPCLCVEYKLVGGDSISDRSRSTRIKFIQVSESDSYILRSCRTISESSVSSGWVDKHHLREKLLDSRLARRWSEEVELPKAEIKVAHSHKPVAEPLKGGGGCVVCLLYLVCI